MKNIKSSHELYIILNKNGTIYCDKNKDFRIYKTKSGLETQKQKYGDKSVAVFTLTDIKEIDELLADKD